MLDGVPVGTLGPAALCGIFVLLVFTGRLVSRYVYEQKSAESERWRLAYENERDARQVSELQSVELLELAKTTKKLIEAIVHPPGGPPQSGGSDVAVQAPPQPRN